MKPFNRFFLALTISLFLLPSTIIGEKLKHEILTEKDYTALKVCEGVIQLFKQFPDSVWPGFNLSQRPFIFYMPEKWALLFNYSNEIDGFTAYPKDWPDLGTEVLFHSGQYKDLAGQLVFGLPIDSLEVAAVSFMEIPVAELFAFIVHENFHQYQQYSKHPAFGEIPWEREEKYPIQDTRNTSLAYLEMRLLMDALKMTKNGEMKKCEDYVKQFVAVRNHRWKTGDAFVPAYEQGQEINEGTAKYVELKSIALMKRLKYKSSLEGLTSSLLEDFSSISMPEYLLHNFQLRITGNSVSPEDMLRNRIYPVGSAQGFLLDYFKVDWKKKAQQAGSEFTFSQLFKDNLNIPESDLGNLLTKAKKNYDYKKILTSTDKLIKEYSDGFNKELNSFEAQTGYRFEIELSTTGRINRSRSSKAKAWVVDRGTRELRSHFNIYVLKSNELFLELHNQGVFEQNDWEAKRKKVVFFIPEITSISLDNNSFRTEEINRYQFKNIEIVGKNLKFNYSKEGTITITNNRVRINLIS